MQGSPKVLRPCQGFCGKLRPPGDKSISHRALMLATLAQEPSRFEGVLPSEDVAATARLCRALGATVETQAETTRVIPPRELLEPEDVVDCGNSGTTARLGLGLLAHLKGSVTLTGDASLRSRPMRRVTQPLTGFGMQFLGRRQADRLPLTTATPSLSAQDFSLPIASGQVKGSLLLAALAAPGTTVLRGRLEGRDHTERMLQAAGVELEVSPEAITLEGGQTLSGLSGWIPADPSSAAFFLVAAAIHPGSELEITETSLNPGRTGVLTVLEAMGAKLTIHSEGTSLGEPIGRIQVQGGGLTGVTWDPEWVVPAIDEVPILAVAALRAQGKTLIQGAEELRVKESDRLAVITRELTKMGAKIEERPDGLAIEGPQELTGAEVESHGDHRIAMALAVAASFAKGETKIHDAEAVAVSYPSFFKDFERLAQA